LTVLDCSRCRHPCGRPDADWYPAGIIRFCRVQVLFLVANLGDLRDGCYPPDPAPNSYTDPGVRSQPRQTAPYERAAQLAAEIDARLQTVPPIQRRLFVVEVEEQLELSGYSRAVLNYIKGWRRKRQSFRIWQADGNRKTQRKMVLHQFIPQV
jgi:hypothetical protein